MVIVVTFDVLTYSILLPLAILNPWMWKTVFIDIVRDTCGSRAWRDFASFRIHSILLQVVALNFSKTILLLLLAIDIATFVNVPYLVASFYHNWRLPGEYDEQGN